MTETSITSPPPRPLSSAVRISLFSQAPLSAVEESFVGWANTHSGNDSSALIPDSSTPIFGVHSTWEHAKDPEKIAKDFTLWVEKTNETDPELLSDVHHAVLLGPAAATGKKVFAFDVDSTLINEEVIELLAEHAGRREEVAEVTSRAMRGELDFAQSLHERVKVLAGLEENVLTDVASHVTLTTGALDFIRAARAKGHVIGAVSGGFSQILALHAKEWGLDTYQANELEIREGKLTGRVTGQIVTASVKAEFLSQLASPDHAEQIKARIAVGDGANDIDMVLQADAGVGLCAKPALREVADIRLDIRHLSALEIILNLQA